MLSPNTILQNRYLVVRKLGEGGMGAVYEAIDQRVSCVVALKETLTIRDREARNAFEREAALLANLRHQALPKVMDYFSENEGDFLVMEYIPGYDLNSRVGRSPRRRRPCHPRRVCALRDSGFGEWCWGKASIEAV